MKYRYFLAAILLSPAAPLAAHEVGLEGPLIQGGLVIGATEPDALVRFDGRAIRVSAEGVFLIGFGRDEVGPLTLEVRHADGGVTTKRLIVEPRQYKLQRIDGLPAKMVTPDPEALARIQRVDFIQHGDARLVRQSCAIGHKFGDDFAVVGDNILGRSVDQMHQHRAAFHMAKKLVP